MARVACLPGLCWQLWAPVTASVPTRYPWVSCQDQDRQRGIKAEVAGEHEHVPAWQLGPLSLWLAQGSLGI